jgi:flavin reductase (DIM6/NTAB) family NADH-FMN oxidoreductase RutF
MRFFKPHKKPQLIEALQLLGQAVNIACDYAKDKRNALDEDDEFLLNLLSESLWVSSAAVQHAMRKAQQPDNKTQH